jgi:8-oxo-dGTP diphosphatase
MADPILGASACIWRDGKVLLIKRGKPPGEGLWSLPGGKIEAGENAETAAVRELLEETQVIAELVHAMGPFEVWRNGVLIYAITCFAGHYVSGEAVSSSDAADVEWVYPQALEGFELAPNIAQAIAEAAKLLKL